MKPRKQDLIQFIVWQRNGTAFCTTWFLILLLVHHYFSDIQAIPVIRLIQLILWTAGGVLIFNLCFTRLLIRRWSFTKRLTCFMGAISLYECFGFYVSAIFTGTGTIWQWLVFTVIVFALYLTSIAIYQSYSKKQGCVYTQALRQYQQSMEEVHSTEAVHSMEEVHSREKA